MHNSERLNGEFQEDLLVYEQTGKFSKPSRNFGESHSHKVKQNHRPVYRFIEKKMNVHF